MRHVRKVCISLLLACVCLLPWIGYSQADDGSTVNKQGICTGLILSDLPVASFLQPIQMPQTPLTSITQEYNPKSGVKFNNSWHYGHNGIDTVGGKFIRAVTGGVVILSRPDTKTGGWGESVILAARAHEFSQEIITTHYHHLRKSIVKGKYSTSRTLQACDNASVGEILGEQGATGSVSGAHLHFTVRRWENLDVLKAALERSDVIDSSVMWPLYGRAYGPPGSTAHLANHLDPEGLLYNFFTDYQVEQGKQAPAYMWSTQYVRYVREHGIEFGLFDGQFGAGTPVQRRDMARWLAIAAGEEGNFPSVATFDDVPVSDADSPYIEAMVRYPSSLSVINANHSCAQGGQYFCPDVSVNRAEALKMVVLAFYDNEYLQLYNDNIWTGALNLAISKLTKFQDVDPFSWYASYVYYGVALGLVADQASFHPSAPVMREEMAKWLAMGYEYLHSSDVDVCASLSCQEGRYCDPNNGQCELIPSCVPSETQTCEVGGGYDSCDDNPVCSPGQKQQKSCGNGGTQTRTCDGSCAWGSWGSCSGSCACSSGICCDGCNYKSSLASCDSWYEYQCGGSNVGDDVQRRTVQQQCAGFTSTCDGQAHPGAWQTWDNCSSSEQCQIVGGTPQCVAVNSCKDTHVVATSSSCSSNPQGSGNPTLCMDVEYVGGTTWHYRICKQGGAFQNDFTYHLEDDNSKAVYVSFDGSAGITCTPWRGFNVAYVHKYGVSNGADMRAYISSPAGCMSAGCQYVTGNIPLWLECK